MSIKKNMMCTYSKVRRGTNGLNLFSIMVKLWWMGEKGIKTEAFVKKLSLFFSLPVSRRHS